MSEEQIQGNMQNLGETGDTLRTLNQAFSDQFHNAIKETSITQDSNINLTEKDKINGEHFVIPDSQKQFAKCQLNFHLTNGSLYQNTILIHPSAINELKQNITANIEKHAETSGFTNLLCLTGSENSDMDFTLLPLKYILYFELKVLFLSKIESDTDEKKEDKAE